MQHFFADTLKAVKQNDVFNNNVKIEIIYNT